MCSLEPFYKKILRCGYQGRVHRERQDKRLTGIGHKAQLWGWLKTVLVPVLGSDQEGVCRVVGLSWWGGGSQEKEKNYATTKSTYDTVTSMHFRSELGVVLYIEIDKVKREGICLSCRWIQARAYLEDRLNL